jgi:uncharacterized protein
MCLDQSEARYANREFDSIFARMIERRRLKTLERLLERSPAVVMLGPRQSGKTTLARAIADERGAAYFDLESDRDRAKLTDIEDTLGRLGDKLVVLDEVHRVPELFQPLRGLIDEGRRKGRRAGRYLLLGSASLDLLRQSGESLAGRLAIVELGPFDLLEVGEKHVDQLWLRGGFPDSFLAVDEDESLRWRRDFIRTYLERDVPQFGPRIPAETLRRFWTMLAHRQAAPLNAAELARNIDVDAKTAARYLDLLVDLLLVRRLPALHRNIGKRLVKSPKVFVRDSGLVHALLGIPDFDALTGHPVVGASWEGFAIETLLTAAPDGTVGSYYRTATGAEIDLVLELPGGKVWAIEVKRGQAPKVEAGFHIARADLEPDKSWVVYGGTETFSLGQDINAIGLHELATALVQMK